MISSGFILDRQIVTIVKDVCAQRSIDVSSFSEDWILRLSREDIVSFVYGYRFGINNSASESIAQDKVATYEVLAAARVPAVPHALVSTRATAHEEWRSLAEGWGRFIVKPLHGGGGRGLKLFEDVERADAHMTRHPELEWCVSPYNELVSETRMILLDGKVVLAYEKTSPQTHDGIPMFNLRLGAKASNVAVSPELKNLAEAAQRAAGLRLTAVDVVRTVDGTLMVLELNDGFSLEHYLRQDDDNYRAAVKVYAAIIDTIFYA